jgi:hypothetical protein
MWVWTSILSIVAIVPRLSQNKKREKNGAISQDDSVSFFG